MAANPCSSSLENILQNLDSISVDGFASDADRSKVLLAAYHLVSRLETPWDTVARLCMTQASRLIHSVVCMTSLLCFDVNNNTRVACFVARAGSQS